MAERLQKIISQAGVSSRRHAEQLIVDGRVKVNGRVVIELGTKVNPSDIITVDEKPLTGEKPIYVLLNKPKGYVTTLSDPQGRKTVAELVTDIPSRIYPVGRLDYNTEGLLLLTNDGELTHGLTHPSKHVMKVYRARIKGLPSEEKLKKLRKGIRLEDGVTAPAQIDFVEYDPDKDTTVLQIAIHEGKNRQIRRMCDAIGHSIKQLKRIKYAFLDLEGVKRGHYRYLSNEEVSRLKRLI